MIGIYKIENTVNQSIYIGSSSNIYRRFSEHKLELFDKTHHNYRLQKDFDIYGMNVFKFNILQICKKEDLFKLETSWTLFYKDTLKRYLYNIKLANTDIYIKNDIENILINSPVVSKKLTKKQKSKIKKQKNKTTKVKLGLYNKQLTTIELIL